MKTLVRWFVIVTLLAVPAISLVALSRQGTNSLPSIEVHPEPLVVAPTPALVDDAQPVVIQVAWGEPQILVAGGAHGTITSVPMDPGVMITNHMSVYSVDGIDVVAASTDEPLYRPLRYGSKGDDVVQLRRFLFDGGYLDDEPTDDEITVDSTVRAAIRDFELATGVPKPTGIFTPSMVVWLPVDSIQVADVVIAAGTGAPGRGEPIASGLRNVIASEVRSSDNSELRVGSGYVFELADTDTVLSIGDAGVNAAELATALFDRGPFDGLPEVLEGTVRRSLPVAVLSVPTSAVVAGSEGRLCVWVAEGSTYSVRPVLAERSRPGVTLVTSGITEHDLVLANPSAILADPSCHY